MKKRRQFTSEFKAKVAIEILAGNKTLAEICSHFKTFLPRCVSPVEVQCS